MAPGKRKRSTTSKRSIEHYTHPDKERVNNPPVGLVTPETDRDAAATTYAYDPHIDPALQWAGKAERTSFEVPTVSLHVHERIDPRSIIEAVRQKNGQDHVQGLTLQHGTGESADPQSDRVLQASTQLVQQADCR